MKERAHVGDGTVQLLEVHVERLALGTPRLLIQPHTLHVETFENWLIKQLLRVPRVLNSYIEFDPADEVRNEPVQPHQVFISQKTFNARRFQTALSQQRLRQIAKLPDGHKFPYFHFLPGLRRRIIGKFEMPAVDLIFERIAGQLGQRLRTPRQPPQLTIAHGGIVRR